MYKLADSVELIKLNQDAILFDKETEDVYSIDAIGLEMLNLLIQPDYTQEQVEQKLMTIYDVDLETLKTDIQILIAQLLRLGLLIRA